MSMESTLGSRKPSFFRRSATVLKCLEMSVSRFRSRPVSYLVPARVATSGSVAGWLVPLPRGESAVSTMSTPASIALSSTMSPVPEVLWVCRWIGTLTLALRALTRSYAS